MSRALLFAACLGLLIGVGCKKPPEAPVGLFSNDGASLELTADKKFVLTLGTDKIEGETSYRNDHVSLYPQSCNGLDEDAMTARSIESVAKTGAGMDPRLITTIFERVELTLARDRKSLAASQPPAFYNGLGTLTQH